MDRPHSHTLYRDPSSGNGRNSPRCSNEALRLFASPGFGHDSAVAASEAIRLFQSGHIPWRVMDGPRMHIKRYSLYHVRFPRSIQILNEDYGDVVSGWTLFCSSRYATYHRGTHAAPYLMQPPQSHSYASASMLPLSDTYKPSKNWR